MEDPVAFDVGKLDEDCEHPHEKEDEEHFVHLVLVEPVGRHDFEDVDVIDLEFPELVDADAGSQKGGYQEEQSSEDRHLLYYDSSVVRPIETLKLLSRLSYLVLLRRGLRRFQAR